mgnify:CR=1 FL=1
MSSKSYSNTIRLVSYLIAAVALAQVVLMFVPYYNNGEVTTSIQGYVWTQYAAFKDYFKTEFANRGLEYAINSQVGAPILMLVLGVLTLVFNVIYPEKIRAIVVALAYGIAAIWGLASTLTLQLGSLYVVHLILAIAVTVLAVLNIVQYVLESRSRIRV